ncbi:citrate (Si)-synthase [Serinibacter arcticus]|uniref:Citrate synthase n=1 Tax=Serinibacter arcticus TaxID=1655435 RepID=A0A2U1ZYM8_9MICO|nr:citrate synthase [Serinibacter arcticus]PWD52089.1 citrate (Si)-synthase [Serinibacter arcticus]
MTASTPTATLAVDGTSVEFERVPAVVGNDGVAISSLLADTGLVTYDPGFMNTANCRSEITYIDGDAGILRYRGYPIEQLAASSNYLEVSYLLAKGELPSKAEFEAFETRVLRHTHVHEDFRRLISSFPRTAHPMAIISSAVSALPGFYPEVFAVAGEDEEELATVLLLAKMPTIVAYVLRHTQGQRMLDVDPENGFVDDFLRLALHQVRGEQFGPEVVAAMDKLLVLHADHEQNCSTATVRSVGSAHTNLFLSVSAGINALSGPLHGGANEAVLTMLEEIRDDHGDAKSFVAKVKDKSSGARLMGFGHRVYKNYDPRAAIVKEAADSALEALGARDELLDIAMGLEEIALSDDYFVSRKLYPNVDFYTGLIYRAMGFPTSMFTPLFAVGRMPGWIAQWREMMHDPTTKIARPRQVYTGPGERDFVSLDAR